MARGYTANEFWHMTPGKCAGLLRVWAAAAAEAEAAANRARQKQDVHGRRR